MKSTYMHEKIYIVHDGKKPFQCIRCGKNFGQSRNHILAIEASKEENLQIFFFVSLFLHNK